MPTTFSLLLKTIKSVLEEGEVSTENIPLLGTPWDRTRGRSGGRPER